MDTQGATEREPLELVNATADVALLRAGLAGVWVDEAAIDEAAILAAYETGVSTRWRPETCDCCVIIDCDRCRRPAAVMCRTSAERLALTDMGQAALLHHPAFREDWLAVELPELPRGHRYGVSSPAPGRRPLERFSAVCNGRRRRPHPRQQITVTAETAANAYRAILDAGRSRIRMRELSSVRIWHTTGTK